MPTYRCTAKCKSCGTLSSPQATQRLSLEQILLAIDQASSSGFGLVVFTGGEATLEMESLLKGISHARSLGLLTRLVTNCHWAESEKLGFDLLNKLAINGLDEINFSTGDQHVRFVPVERVLTAVRMALKLGFSPAVMVETTLEAKVCKSYLESFEYHKETVRLFPGRIIKFSESPWMPLKPGKFEKYPDGMAVDSNNLHAVHGCDSVLQTVTVQADGVVGACCGLGMRLIQELHLGNLGSTSITSMIDEAESDFLKRWIRIEGPEKILAWAASKDPEIKWEGQYAHRCQACIRLYKDESVRSVIRLHYEEKVADVIFGEYLIYSHNVSS